MDNENASCAHDCEEDAQLSLLDFPVEIFLHICSFLEASTLVHGLSLVCKQFYLILKDDSLWKARINHIWPDANYPLLRPARPDELFWKLSCIAVEKQTALWKQRVSMEKLITNTTQYNGKALLLMHDGTICIGCALNDTLVYWKLPSREKIPSHEIGNSVCSNSRHKGTIFDLTAIDNTIYSCSWDSSVKSWMLVNTGLFQQKIYKMIAPGGLLCLSSCQERSLFATGSYNKTIFVFDSRSGRNIKQYQPHTDAVIKLAMNAKYILSASKDKTVSVWDQRAGRTMKSITFSGDGYPTCMSMQRDWVCIGDSTAKLHVLNPKNDFKLVKSYATEHTKGIRGVHLMHGCLITSSMDGTVRISSPTDPPKPIVTLLPGLGSIFRMDYQNDVLAISGDDTAVWRPKLAYSTKHQ